MAKTRLSIVLIKKDTPRDMIVRMQEGVSTEMVGGRKFVYKRSFTTPPKWLESFFHGNLNCAQNLKSTSASAVLLVDRVYDDVQRTFALCFGYGKSLLQPSCIEERFGLITALNCVDQDKLRSVDINRLDLSSLKSRIQSTKLSGVADLEFDVDKSLLRQATGLSNDEDMGTTIAGSDTLSISVEADVNNIEALLDHCYEKYNSTNYKSSFSWVDHISPIKKGAIIGTLDEMLLEKLQNEEESKTWLAVPDIISWDDISELKFSEHGPSHGDILMEDFKEEVLEDREINVSYLKHHYVIANDDNGTLKHKWSYYRCIYSEIEYNNLLYILNAGEWYQVDRDYVQEIQRVYDSVPISNISVIDYNHENENKYNEALADSSADYYMMDKSLIPSGVAGNNLEFCDVYHREGKMIHVKKYGGSQVLGHLFNQGRVFGGMLLLSNIRDKVNEQLPDGWQLPSDFLARNYEVVYGIISKYPDERPHIPFFSMIVFNDVFHILTGYGYRVSLKTITNLKLSNNTEN